MNKDKETEVLRSTGEISQKFGLTAEIRGLAEKETIERKREMSLTSLVVTPLVVYVV